MWDKVLVAISDIVSTQERIKRLERNVEALTTEIVDVDSRLIRVETIIEMSGVGRPPPRLRRLPRS